MTFAFRLLRGLKALRRLDDDEGEDEYEEDEMDEEEDDDDGGEGGMTLSDNHKIIIVFVCVVFGFALISTVCCLWSKYKRPANPKLPPSTNSIQNTHTHTAPPSVNPHYVQMQHNTTQGAPIVLGSSVGVQPEHVQLQSSGMQQAGGLEAQS
eukprot:GDKI01001288.1.p1 GENE.GDKI01001288.1~~GDKI01001288.1.p1  ORF type:complete len:152 (-),score=57.43 GDKI01001288.1:141-596(-)